MNLRIISELCGIEIGLYLDYYNDRIKSYKAFTKKLEREKKNIINKVYDLLEEGHDEKEIIPAIKSQVIFYKESPEYFGEDDDSSNYPSGYYETEKKKKYPFHERCGNTLSLVKRLFKARKSVKAEISLRDKLSEEGVRKLIVSHIDASKDKKSKRKKQSRKSKGLTKGRRSKKR